MIKERKILPAVALRGITILPQMVIHFDVSREKSVKAIEETIGKHEIFLVAQREMNVINPEKEDLYEVGCIAEIKQVIKLKKDILRVIVVGRERAIIEDINTESSYLKATVNVWIDEEDMVADESDEQQQNAMKINEEANVRELRELYVAYIASAPRLNPEILDQVHAIQERDKMVELILANCEFHYTDLQIFLEEMDKEIRYTMLLAKLADEIEVNTIKEAIHNKVKENVDKSQKEFVLREEMRVIREELGEDSSVSDAEEFLHAAEKLKASAEVKNRLKKEIKRFKNMHNQSSENGVLRTYIETMLEMPWNKTSKDNYDLAGAKKALDKEHYGMEEVKERILEFLAVKNLTINSQSPILCLVGPPGTGKTSIAKSLADAMNKKYARISLGGIRDEAEIRGHRKTYVGAMPGRIANAMRQAGTKNPLVLLDEIDKVSTDHKGDTYSALLEVLDAEQNVKFRDHYLEVPLDLSQVLFVATANSLQTIPRPLLDRMEIIEINSYTENEKVHIAQRHLIPKQLKIHGLYESGSELKISKGVIEKIARNYTKEAGVRQLERKIASLCRKVAKEMVEMKKNKVRITEQNVVRYLGEEKYRYQMINDKNEIGIVRGLAWTSVGGDTLQIEVNVMLGKGELKLTGQLGNVMKESATAAMSYVRSESEKYQIANNYFSTHDIHVHIPEGAVPKDGPSAGITMATAILSAIIEREVRADVAMTGEITLRGRVLPVGGLKEKLLAAKNAGIKTVIIPMENQRDVAKITAEITKDLEIIPVDHMSRVCEIAFVQ